jgi:hypothetical protein
MGACCSVAAGKLVRRVGQASLKASRPWNLMNWVGVMVAMEAGK